MGHHESRAYAFFAVLAKSFRFSVSMAAVVAVLLPAGNTAWAGGRGPVRLLTTIPVPVTAANNTAGGLYSFDISWVDQSVQAYFLADRSNRVVDVVDAQTATFLGQASANPPFRGFLPCSPPAGANDCAGPNGVVAAFPWLFVTDAGSRVVTIDLRTGATVADVVTMAGEPTRADELAYNRHDGLLLVINNASTPPFGTLIKVDQTTGGLTVVKTILLDAAHGVDAQNGAEQPVWHHSTARFYLSIPQIGSNVQNGGVVRINPTTGAIEKTYPVKFCGPAGLTAGPPPDLLVGCNTVFDTAGNVWDPNGTVSAAPKAVILNVLTGGTTDVPGVGAGDEVWFNKGDGNYYVTGSGSPFRPLPAATAKGVTPLNAIDAADPSLIQSASTYNVPAGTGHPAGTAHSVAANAENNRVFVPLAANNAFPHCLTGCIAVFTSEAE
jgi:hypothetical protein